MAIRFRCPPTVADPDRLLRLRAQSHRLIEQSRESLDRAAALLARLPVVWSPGAPAPDRAADPDVRAAILFWAAELADATREIIDRAAWEVARSRADVARTQVLRAESRALRARAGEGPGPDPAPRPAAPPLAGPRPAG